jgi:hypothetical protein
MWFCLYLVLHSGGPVAEGHRVLDVGVHHALHLHLQSVYSLLFRPLFREVRVWENTFHIALMLTPPPRSTCSCTNQSGEAGYKADHGTYMYIQYCTVHTYIIETVEGRVELTSDFCSYSLHPKHVQRSSKYEQSILFIEIY